MSTTGPGGVDIDVGASGKDYFPYLIYSGKDVSAVLSNARNYGDVATPDGWRICRKLRFGFRYDMTWGGIPSFHNSDWPNPFLRLTDAEASPDWQPCSYVICQATSWATVSLDRWMPDNARMAYLMIETRGVGSIYCSAYLRSYAGQSVGVWVGSASPGSQSTSTSLFIRTDSLHGLQYQVTSGCGITIQILGYDMSEPS